MGTRCKLGFEVAAWGQEMVSAAYQGPLQVLEAFEEPTKAPKIAFEAPPGHPPLQRDRFF